MVNDIITFMTVCYFGTYESNYPRNRIIINGLRINGVKVMECHIDRWQLEEDKTKILKLPLNLIIIPFQLLFTYLLLLYRYFATGSYKYQIIIVGYPGHMDVFIAYLLSFLLRKHLVFNPLISIYDTVVNDRRLVKENSIIATFILLLEKIIFRLPKIILLDTYAHISLLRKVLSIPKKIKMARIFVGADEKLFPFNSYRKPKSILEVNFIGKFTPLHGLPTIIKAAKLLEKYKNIHFTIVGKGQLSEAINNLKNSLKLNNAKFIPWIPYNELSHIINDSDICLGIFDNGEKAQSVIPNKIFSAIAMGKAVITSNSLGIKELFQNNKNIILCPSDSPDSLAKKIMFLNSNRKILEQIAMAAHELFEQKLTEDKIGKEVKEILESLH